MMARAKASNGTSESLFDALMRVNANQREKDRDGGRTNHVLDRIVKKFGIYVIDFTLNRTPNINGYIYKLCLDVTKSESRDGSDPRDKQMKALTHSESNHRVIIFDGLNCFNCNRFQSLSPGNIISSSISMVFEPDPLRLLVTIYRYFSEQAALNFDLRLVVIYFDEMYVQDLMSFLIRHKLSLHLVLVSYNVSNTYSKGLYHGEVQGIEYLSLDSSNGSLLVKKSSNGKVKDRAVFRDLFQINSKSNPT